MPWFKSQSFILYLVVFAFTALPRNLIAQQAHYGDSESFRGIEEQAKRRSKVEADTAAITVIYARHTSEVNRINAESAAQWDALHANHRQSTLNHKARLSQNSTLPVVLQKQYFDIVRLDIQKYEADVQYLRELNRAQIEYATVKNMIESLHVLQNTKNAEAASRQTKLLEEARRTYNVTLENLDASRARASQLSDKKEIDVTNYNKSFVAWKEVNNTSYTPQTSGGSTGSSGDDYDLAGALRDRLRNLNNGHGH